MGLKRREKHTRAPCAFKPCGKITADGFFEGCKQIGKRCILETVCVEIDAQRAKESGIPNFFQPGSEKFLAPLPNPFTNTAMPLSIALLTFFWIHFTAMRYKGWGYFKRYTEPFAVFLPINLVTMWSPVLSLTLRLFGNALAGFCVVTLVYTGFEYAFTTVGVGLALTPLLAPIVHLYFDVFDGLIQLTVFCMLTMMNVAAEYVSPEELAEAKRAQEEKRAQRQRRRMSRRSAGAPRA